MTEYTVILYTALLVGFTHTLLGPDHYIPFIALSKSMNLSIKKTMVITFICGLGHVMSSIIIGLIGIIFGKALMSLVKIESIRGELAAILLLIFGFTYFVWGIWQVIKNRPHNHIHSHHDIVHTHSHTHENNHLHIHENKGMVSMWILFIIFVFGPCEPLIPLIMYPAAKVSLFYTIAISTTFAVSTLITMLAIVYFSVKGVNSVRIEFLNRYSHAFAGFIVLMCGVLVKFFDF